MPYAFQDNQWVGFDDTESFRAKVRLALLGGGAPPLADLRPVNNTNTQTLFVDECCCKCPDISSFSCGSILNIYHLLMKKRHKARLGNKV